MPTICELDLCSKPYQVLYVSIARLSARSLTDCLTDLCSKPYLFNNPRFPAANSTVQVRHWWHPTLVRNITTQLFAAGADSVNGERKADAFLLDAAA